MILPGKNPQKKASIQLTRYGFALSIYLSYETSMSLVHNGLIKIQNNSVNAAYIRSGNYGGGAPKAVIATTVQKEALETSTSFGFDWKAGVHTLCTLPRASFRAVKLSAFHGV